MEVPFTPLDFARRTRRLHGHRLAVVDGTLRMTYEEFLSRCDRSSAALEGLGVGRGDRVAVIAPNTHGHLEQYYAVPQLGEAPRLGRDLASDRYRTPSSSRG